LKTNLLRSRIARRRKRACCTYAAIRIYGGPSMVGGRASAFPSFACPNCQALYRVAKVEAGPETTTAKYRATLAAVRRPRGKASLYSSISTCGKLRALGSEHRGRQRGGLIRRRQSGPRQLCVAAVTTTPPLGTPLVAAAKRNRLSLRSVADRPLVGCEIL
jgi:hypothetical protein